MKPLRVAVIGATGIGRNHVGWFLKHGCEVVAFVGSSPERVAATQTTLQNMWGFDGRGYTSTAGMLREESPDAVCVSSPQELHYEQVLQCFEAGAHVLCEKPLVNDPAKECETLIHEARHLHEVATARNLLFSTQMQYATATETILDLCGIANRDEVRTLSVVMETKNVKHNRHSEEIWIDLSPHTLCMLRSLAPHGDIDWSTARCDVRNQETTASCTFRRADGSTIEADMRVGVNPNRDVPLRSFQMDGHTVEYSARRNAADVFCAYLQNESGTTLELPDFVDTLIGNFVRACRNEEQLLVTGEDGARVVEWQLKMLEQSRSNK